MPFGNSAGERDNPVSDNQKTGGLFFMLEGQAEAPRTKQNDQTGEVSTSVNVRYWGGETYVRFADLAHATKVKEGDWVQMKCPARTYEGRTYPGAGLLLSVNGTKV